MLIVYDRTFSTASVQCDDDAEQPWLRESQQVRMPQVIPPQSTRRKRRRKPMSKKKQRRKSKRKSRHHLSRKHKQPKQSKQAHVHMCIPGAPRPCITGVYPRVPLDSLLQCQLVG